MTAFLLDGISVFFFSFGCKVTTFCEFYIREPRVGFYIPREVLFREREIPLFAVKNDKT